MYSIGNLIFGIPIEDELYKKIEKELGKLWEQEFEDDLLYWYSGDGEKPLAWGIKVGSFDACGKAAPFIELLQMTYLLDDRQGTKFSMPTIPEKLKKFINPLLAQFYIVWSTS